MTPGGRPPAPDDAAARLAAAYPEPGSVLIVSAHCGDDTIAPAVVGWQVVRLLATGDQRDIGGVHIQRSAARAFAEATFPNIVGWQKLGATVLAARVADPGATIAVEGAAPRRRANGLRIPLWRS